MDANREEPGDHQTDWADWSIYDTVFEEASEKVLSAKPREDSTP